MGLREKSLSETVSFEGLIINVQGQINERIFTTKKVIVFIILPIFLREKKMIINDEISAAYGMFTFHCCLVRLHEQINTFLFLNNS